MADEKLTNRWIMVAAALVMQLCLGVLYAYSVFRGPLMKEVGFTVKQAGYPLMASFFFFAVGMIVAGRWQDKAGPKKVAIFGGLLLAQVVSSRACCTRRSAGWSSPTASSAASASGSPT